MHLLKEISRSATHLLFPKLCEGCRLPLLKEEDILCLSCTTHLPRHGAQYHNTPDNEAALRFAGRVPYQNVTAFAPFYADSLLQHLLHRLKYHGRRHIGLYLGKQFGYDLKDAGWIQTIDVIVPVPLHPKKEAGRGYNQSALIAEGLGSVTGKDVLPHGLVRDLHTESQTQKSRAERVENVKDAFSLSKKQPLANKHVLLLDDVLTTGATLEAAATALLQAQGAQVSIVVIGMAAG